MSAGRRIQLTIYSGATSCAASRGTFCEHVRTTHFGQRWHCQVFGLPLVDVDGWLQRVEPCLAAETRRSSRRMRWSIRADRYRIAGSYNGTTNVQTCPGQAIATGLPSLLSRHTPMLPLASRITSSSSRRPAASRSGSFSSSAPRSMPGSSHSRSHHVQASMEGVSVDSAWSSTTAGVIKASRSRHVGHLNPSTRARG